MSGRTFYANVYELDDGAQFIGAWCSSRVWVDQPSPSFRRRIAIIRARSKPSPFLAKLESSPGVDGYIPENWIGSAPELLPAHIVRLADERPDGSGLDDGPPIPGRAPRKKADPKSADELRAIRRKAWATRRARK